jgi:hypothetical protein
VTRHHARYAEKMAAAADRLGEILDRQGKTLAEVAELNALVTAIAAGPTYASGRQNPRLGELVKELEERRGPGRS